MEENIIETDYRFHNFNETSTERIEKEFKKVTGSGKKSTMILACDNPGEKLPPLIIFQGKYLYLEELTSCQK